MALGDLFPTGRGQRSGGQSPALRQWNSVVDSFFNEFLSPSRVQNRATFVPRVNISEDERSVKVTTELPGMNEDDVEIEFTRGGLLLRGEKREEKRDTSRSGYYEISYGSFERFIPIDTDVDEQVVQAQFERGVLTITLPKTEQARTRGRKIPIQSSGQANEQEQQSEGYSKEQRTVTPTSETEGKSPSKAKGTEGLDE